MEVAECENCGELYEADDLVWCGCGTGWCGMCWDTHYDDEHYGENYD